MVGAAPNPGNNIVVRNIPPPSWEGRQYDVGLYKNGQLLIVHPNLRVGDQAVLLLKPKLFFGLVHDMKEGEIFASAEGITSLTEFDLGDFPNGLQVVLSDVPGGFVFHGEQM